MTCRLPRAPLVIRFKAISNPSRIRWANYLRQNDAVTCLSPSILTLHTGLFPQPVTPAKLSNADSTPRGAAVNDTIAPFTNLAWQVTTLSPAASHLGEPSSGLGE